MQSRRAELGARFRALSELTVLSFDDVFRWCLTRNTQWEPREIIAAMTRCIRADSADRWSRLALADALRRVGRIDDAEAALAPLPGSDNGARILRAEIALDRGNDRAVAVLLAGGPADHPGLARLRGRIALARHDGPTALDHFRIAVAADPDSPPSSSAPRRRQAAITSTCSASSVPLARPSGTTRRPGPGTCWCSTRNRSTPKHAAGSNAQRVNKSLRR
jgi:hypothetical protein